MAYSSGFLVLPRTSVCRRGGHSRAPASTDGLWGVGMGHPRASFGARHGMGAQHVSVPQQTRAGQP